MAMSKIKMEVFSLMETMINQVVYSEFSVGQFLINMGGALIAGLLLSFVYMYQNKFTKSFVVTLAMIPAVVSMVIMMVNGNIGAGVAVAGAFSLVRFRSVPGTAREIGAIFIAMGAGLSMGMGYVFYGILFVILLSGVNLLYVFLEFGKDKSREKSRILRITIPESLDYVGVFEDLFLEYLDMVRLIQVKTTNMGSMFKLQYEVILKEERREKELMDDIRCRNGNLEVSLSRMEIQLGGEL